MRRTGLRRPSRNPRYRPSPPVPAMPVPRFGGTFSRRTARAGHGRSAGSSRLSARAAGSGAAHRAGRAAQVRELAPGEVAPQPSEPAAGGRDEAMRVDMPQGRAEPVHPLIAPIVMPVMK